MKKDKYMYIKDEELDDTDTETLASKKNTPL
jgi:hypothetical protein